MTFFICLFDTGVQFFSLGLFYGLIPVLTDTMSALYNF